MSKKSVYLGDSPLKQHNAVVKGEYVEIDREKFYKISNYNHMLPFFMSIVSDSDHWMFISSKGGLTAGRKNPDHAIFPYYTDDKIHDSNELTGNKAILFIEKEERCFLWEPFSDYYSGIYRMERNIYKNPIGNKLIFEEVNEDLNIVYRYSWNNSDEFGFIKTTRLINRNNHTVQVSLLDGIQNILPAGVELAFQNTFSTLVDAYKKSELIPQSRIGIYSLSSIPVDKAEPSESLKATIVWSAGLPGAKILLSSRQLDAFRETRKAEQETDIRALRGAYFMNADFTLSAQGQEEWRIMVDTGKDISHIAWLEGEILPHPNVNKRISESIEKGSDNLVRIVANADGLQLTGDEISASRHFSNTLFNVMRGGVFYRNYQVDKKDFLQYIYTVNKIVAQQESVFLNTLAEKFQYGDLLQQAALTHDEVLIRICYEYLPLTFSRRHGDPSRPWNLFSIETRHEDGSQILSYQGNWRDIFQNWEALAQSFPGFIESMICKFVNASTADGYNPYRITRNGIDWEVINPHEPWSNIGYWGDHQIIYLLKLLELSQKFHPGKIENFLTRELFTYANVPYKINPYEEIIKNPFVTIRFDEKLHRLTQERTSKIGADGKLVMDDRENICRVNLTEKLLVTLLAKFSNFVPEAGIWMNTQRPEWNDANNALVGNGVSMVTLYYMRRYVKFLHRLFSGCNNGTYHFSDEVRLLFDSIKNIFDQHIHLLKNRISDSDRRKIVDQLGNAGSGYRGKVYENGFSTGKHPVSREQLISFCESSLRFIDHSISANKRSDNLYNAYNLIRINKDNTLSVIYLYEMLEGQVAVLSSGYLDTRASLELLDALRGSALYRKDQNSYILYPDRQLPRFAEKNTIPEKDLNASVLLKKLIADGDSSVVMQDVRGNYHFKGTFRNAQMLNSALDALDKDRYGKLAEDEREQILDLYEKMFNHRAFTGRSGTFFKYEGLGSIYWHMVSKLLLATAEIFNDAVQQSEDERTISRIKEHYYEIKAGIGLYKTPEAYGSFPTDPYSHTPGHAGVQQPGMTGQVKEDILSRFNELGMHVKDGRIGFSFHLLKDQEFISQPKTFDYYDINQEKKEWSLAANQLAFTFCQVPVLYQKASENKAVLQLSDGSRRLFPKPEIDEEFSLEIFNRTGKVSAIEVYFGKNQTRNIKNQ